MPQATGLQDGRSERTALPRVSRVRLRPDRLGHEAIDRDHREIAECWGQAVDCAELPFVFLIARLRKLMAKHFEHEAALMAQAGGKLCECHQREHLVLLDVCDRAAALGRRNVRKAQALLRHELPRRVREHLSCMDQLAVLFINTNGGRPRA